MDKELKDDEGMEDMATGGEKKERKRITMLFVKTPTSTHYSF